MFVNCDWQTVCGSIKEIKEEYNIDYTNDGWYWNKKTNNYIFIEEMVVNNIILYRLYCWNSYNPRSDMIKIANLPIYEVSNI